LSVTAGVAAAFVQSVLPVLLIGSLGYLVGRARPIDLAPITGLTVLVLAPAIVFYSLARAALPRELLSRLVLHVGLQLLAIWLLTVLVARLVGWRGPAEGAFLLATLFSNSGNVGLPLALFAFGQDGLAIAGGWFAVMSIGSSVIGPYLAARSRAGTRAALGRVGRQPIIYAVVAGTIVNLFGWSLPGPIAKASELLAGGAVALMLLLLGLQLARMTVREEATGAVLATVIRLVAVPPIAWAVGKLVGLEGMALAVAVLQASMPTAVTSALWALEFDARPALVSAAVVLSTAVSVVTLTVLLAVLTQGLTRMP
jgi:predicted permease